MVYCQAYGRYYHQILTNDNVKTHPYDFYVDEPKADYFKIDIPHTLTANIVNGETRLIRYVFSINRHYRRSK